MKLTVVLLCALPLLGSVGCQKSRAEVSSPPGASVAVMRPPSAASALRTLVNEVITSDQPTARVASITGVLRAWGPPQTTVTVAGQSTVLGPEGRGEIALDEAPIVAALRLSRNPDYQWIPRVDTAMPLEFAVTVARPNSAPVSGTLRLTGNELNAIAGRWLHGVQRGPLGGMSTGARGGVVVVLRDNGTRAQLTGRLEQTSSFADIAVIAVVREQERRGSCGTYVRSTTGTRSNVEWIATDANVTVFERSTGRALATQTFAASTPRCTSRLQSTPRTSYEDSPIHALLSRNLPRA